jgi:hypothetical protein
MNSDLADELLRKVMEDAADADFPEQLGVLRNLAAYKYDDYQQYAPGRQFIECLALWLDQFSDPTQRRNALRFVYQRLVYVSEAEMRHLVSLMARDRVPSVLRRRVASQMSIPTYRVASLQFHEGFRKSLRSSLFLGMSDGARIDQFRRNSAGLSNEQFATNYELSDLRANKMLVELRKDLHDKLTLFSHVFLVDDFAGSGATILRNSETGHPEGRLVRFIQDTLPKLAKDECPQIFISLYLITEQALRHLRSLIAAYPSPPWCDDNAPQVLPVLVLNEEVCLRHGRGGDGHELDPPFDEVLHQYYDKSIEDEHKGEVLHGYSDCGLPLVLCHNTPNNSLYLIWEKEKTYPLFPRFERHQGRPREE